MPTTNEEIADAVVAYRLRVLRSEAATVKALLAVFDASLGKVAEEMAAVGASVEQRGSLTTREQARLVRLYQDLQATTVQTQRVLAAAMGRDLSAVATVTARVVTEAVRGAFPEQLQTLIGGVPVLDVAEMVNTPLVGAPWGERLAADLVAVDAELRSILGESLARGASIPKTVKRLKQAGLVAETYRGRLTTLARTEFQRVANQATHAVYDENRDVLRGVIHLSTLDSRTCPICAGLHQKRYLYGPGGELLPNPTTGEWRQNPQHPRCRCMDAPWVKSWRDLGIPVTTARDRERMDGRAPERMDFGQWLSRQPKSTQVEVLGPARWELWQAGTPIEDFSDQGELLTIQELSESMRS